MIEFKELKAGDVFQIADKTTRPLLRIETGYVEMRNDEVIEVETIAAPLELIEKEKLFNTLGGPAGDIQKWIDKLAKKYKVKIYGE